MQSRRIIIASVLVLTSIPCFAYNHARRGPTSGLFKHRSSKSAPKPTGPRVIESQRATEIQTALIKAGYLTGEPSGRWDSESQEAMQKLQASKGWQTKMTPDSRALILLGLGPQQSKADDADQSSRSNTSALSNHSGSSSPAANGLKNPSFASLK